MNTHRLYDALFLVIVFLILLLTGLTSFGQSVGINTTTPHPSSLLELNAIDKGLLAPRMTNAQRNLIGAPANGLIIFQTDAVGTEVAGLYYYDASLPGWVRFSDQSKDAGWKTNGNAGTNSTTDFLGTTDAQDLVVRTNNVERMRITKTGKAGIGPLMPGSTYPYSRLDLSDEDGNNSDLVMRVAGGVTGYPQLIFNKSRGTLAAPTVTNNGDWTGVIVGRAWDGTNWTNTSAIIMGADSTVSTNLAPGNIVFSTASTISNGEKMRITRNGRVGIGTSTPFTRLQITTNDSSLQVQTIKNAHVNGWSGIWFASSGGILTGHTGYGNVSTPRWSNKFFSGSITAIPYVFTTNDAERMRLHSGGELSVGDTIATGKVRIAANSFINYPQLTLAELDTFDFARLMFTGFNTGRNWQIAARTLDTDPNDDMNIYNTSYGNLMTFKWNGDIGIGTTSPSVKLDLYSAGLIPMRVRSTAATGYSLTQYINNNNMVGHIGWGNSGAATFTNTFYAGTSSNMPFVLTTGDVERVRISTTGNVGIGNNNPIWRIDVSDVQSVARLVSTGHVNGSVVELKNLAPGAGGILGAVNFNNAADVTPGQIAYTATDDMTFRAGGTEKVRIKGTGFVGIGTNSPTTQLEVNGYTKLGTNAPAVKMVKVTSTTAATQGGWIDIPMGVTATKVLAIDILVEYGAGLVMPKNFTINPGYEYDCYMNGTNLRVFNKTGNSSFILSKPVRVLITYEI